MRLVLRRPGWVLGVLLALGAAARVVNVLELRESPLLHMQVWSESDMSFYDRWARNVASGDLLTNTRMRPYHSGHAAVARGAHALLGITKPFDQNVAERLWDVWLGERTFYQDPLYAYMVGGVYALFGPRLGPVIALQGAMGLGIVALLFALTRRLFSDAEAIVAGLVAALYAPLLYYEVLLLKPVLIAFTGIGALYLIVRAVQAPVDGRRYFVAGLGCGAAFLAQSSALLFVAPVLVLVALRARREGASLRTSAGALLLGFVLALLPAVGRNLAVGAPPFVFNATGAWTFMNHNADDYDPKIGDTITTHAHEILVHTSGKMLPTVVETLRTHPSPGHWLQMLAGKLATFWHWYELPNNTNFEYYRTQAPVSRFLFVFSMMAPFAALGLALGAWRKLETMLAATFVASGLAMLIVFYQISRLRFPIAVSLIPFAAFGALEFLRYLLDGRAAAFGASLLATAALFVAMLRPLPAGQSTFRLADYGVPNDIAVHLAQQKAATGDLAGAVRLLERQLAIEPESLRRMDPQAGSARVSPQDIGFAGTFAKLHALAAGLYGEQGELDLSSAHARRARMLEAVSRSRVTP